MFFVKQYSLFIFLLFSLSSVSQTIKNKSKNNKIKIAPTSVVTNTTAPKQKEIEIRHASKIEFDKNKSEAKILTGDVICAHDGAILTCDTALIFDGDNKMQASGHIKITKGDSITVTGNKLFYDGKTKIARLDSNVKCVEKDMILTTHHLTFDVGNSIANYYDGGTIINKQNTLTSKNGHYYSATKEVAFHYDVELVNPEYKMKSDTSRYNTITKTAYFLGPSIILSKNDYIYCENGWYNTDKEKAQFSQHALLITKEQKLTGDSLFYDRVANVGRAYRNVRLIDTAQKSILYGDYIEYKEKKSEALVTKHALYARIIDNDTLFISADTLYHRDLDSVNNFLNAYHHVKLFKKDIQAQADSASLNTIDSLIQLFKTPVLWSKNSQATAKLIKINIGKSAINGFKLEGNAFLIQQVDSLKNNTKFNQLSGRSIEAFIRQDTIRKAIVSGNANALYFPTSKNKAVGLNKTNCTEILLWFKNQDIERVTLKPNTEGEVTPIKDVNLEEANLKGFNWIYNKRPKSKKDLFVR